MTWSAGLSCPNPSHLSRHQSTTISNSIITDPGIALHNVNSSQLASLTMAPCSGFYCLNDAQQSGAIFCIVTTVVILALVYWYVVLRKRPQHARDDPEWEMVMVRRRRQPAAQSTTPLSPPSMRRPWSKFMGRIHGKKDDSKPNLSSSTRSEGRAAATQTDPPGFFQRPAQVQRPPPVAHQQFVVPPPPLPPPPPPGVSTLGLQQYQGQANTGYTGPVLFSSMAPFGSGPHLMHGHQILLHPLPACPSVPPVIPQGQPKPHQTPSVDTPKRSFWSRFTRDHRPIPHPPPGRASTVLSTPSTRVSGDMSRSRSRSLSRGRTLKRSARVGETKRKSRSPTGRQGRPRRTNRHDGTGHISADKIVPSRRPDTQMATPVLSEASVGQQTQTTSQLRPARDTSPPGRPISGRHLPSTESLRPSTPSYPASSVSEDQPQEKGGTIGQRFAQIVPQVPQAAGKSADEPREARNSQHGLRRPQEGAEGRRGDERCTTTQKQNDDEPRMGYENRHGPYRHDGVIPDGQVVRPQLTPAREHNQADDQSLHSDAETYHSFSSGMIAEAGSDYSDVQPIRRTDGREGQEKRKESPQSSDKPDPSA